MVHQFFLSDILRHNVPLSVILIISEMMYLISGKEVEINHRYGLSDITFARGILC